MEGCPSGRGGCNSKAYFSLPHNPKLRNRAQALRKAGNLSEVLLWNQLKIGMTTPALRTTPPREGNEQMNINISALRLQNCNKRQVVWVVGKARFGSDQQKVKAIKEGIGVTVN